MAWTWDRYRETAAVWHPGERQHLDPLARFYKVVDRMFYAAAAAFAITILALLMV